MPGPLRVGVINPKGGVGKSTLSVHLARAVQIDGHSSVIVDTDPQGSAKDWRERSPDGYEGPQVVHTPKKSVLRGEIDDITDGYDVAVIDGPARLDDQGTNGAIISLSDAVLVPVQPSALDLWGTMEFLDLLQEEVDKGRVDAAFVASRRDPRTSLADEILEGFEGIDLPVFRGTCKRVAFNRSMAEGKTVFETDDAKAKNECMELLQDTAQLVS